jgi:hypothetical protein
MSTNDCQNFYDFYQRIEPNNDTLTPNNCCTWDTFKVQCLETRIITMNLQDLTTGGVVIPNLFDSFTTLRGLNLSNSQFIGSIPPSLASKPFYFLNLSNNRLNGTLPNLQIEQGHESTFLDLRGNMFVGDVPEGLKRSSQAPRLGRNEYCPFDDWLCSDTRLDFCDFDFKCTDPPVSTISTGDTDTDTGSTTGNGTTVDDVSTRFSENGMDSPGNGFTALPIMISVSVTVNEMVWIVLAMDLLPFPS